MTIYYPSLSQRDPKWTRRMKRKIRTATRSAHNARVTRSFSEQWKRYPNSKNVLDLRTGQKTNTTIFPEGYDQTYEGPSWHDMPPILGGGPATYSGPRIKENIDALYRPMTGRMIHIEHSTEYCPNCKKPLGNCVGESAIYGSQDVPDLCEPCWLDEEDLIDRVGSNSPDLNPEIRKRLEHYRS